jgi:hypothetical protein
MVMQIVLWAMVVVFGALWWMRRSSNRKARKHSS